jgi:MraZ protein
MFMGFRGHSYRSLDAKGRLMLPPDFRETVFRHDSGGRVMLTNFDGCVAGYPWPEWETIEQSFKTINVASRQLRNFRRFFISGAMEVTLDKQGRILVPPYLRDYAQLGKDVVLSGDGKKFEIWNLENFSTMRQDTDGNFDEIMDSIADHGVELHL